MQTLVEALYGLLEGFRIYYVAQLCPNPVLDDLVNFYNIRHHLFELVYGPVNVLEVQIVGLDYLLQFSGQIVREFCLGVLHLLLG